jgi:hypothetical protein
MAGRTFNKIWRVKKNDLLLWMSGPSGQNIPFNLANPDLAKEIPDFNTINPPLITGTILKRLLYYWPACEVGLKPYRKGSDVTVPYYTDEDMPHQVPIAEFWIANNAASKECQLDICKQVYFRWTMAQCNESLGSVPNVAGNFWPLTNFLIDFQTDPARYRHWKLATDGAIATLTLDVNAAAGLYPGTELKLNSYDLGVDIELADAVQRLRLEHPEVRAVVLRSGKDNVFCAGANIGALAKSAHGDKVNFCKFTNETRLAIEDASANSGQRYLAAVSGAATSWRPRATGSR